MVTVEFAVVKFGKSIKYVTLELTDEEYVYWLYLRGLTTEEEFLDATGIESWDERDEELWQRVKAMRKGVNDAS